MERTGSTVVVHTTAGTFVWLEPTFAHEFPRGACGVDATYIVARIAVVDVGTSDEQGRFTFEHVIPGTYNVSGFADATPVETIANVNGAHVEVRLR
jgi:hypothetical protein